MVPEQVLWLNVIQQALSDATYPDEACTGLDAVPSLYDKRNAINWIFGRHPYDEQNRNDVCRSVGVSVKQLRGAYYNKVMGLIE